MSNKTTTGALESWQQRLWYLPGDWVSIPLSPEVPLATIHPSRMASQPLGPL